MNKDTLKNILDFRFYLNLAIGSFLIVGFTLEAMGLLPHLLYIIIVFCVGFCLGILNENTRRVTKVLDEPTKTGKNLDSGIINSSGSFLIDRVGESAMLEQAAEESCELTKACLKYSRLLRNENPTKKTKEECVKNLIEEAADVLICIDELKHGGLIIEEEIQYWVYQKKESAKDRFTKDVKKIS